MRRSGKSIRVAQNTLYFNFLIIVMCIPSLALIPYPSPALALIPYSPKGGWGYIIKTKGGQGVGRGRGEQDRGKFSNKNREGGERERIKFLYDLN